LDHRCNSRFTHANRHCADHPFASLRRCHELALQPLTTQAVENSPDVVRWLENYKRRNEEKTPGKTCDANYDSDSNSLKKSSHSKAWKSQEQQENINERSNDKFKNRRNRGGIAKALQYGSSENCNESTVPLYRYYLVYSQFEGFVLWKFKPNISIPCRKLCEAVDPSPGSFGCTPLHWSSSPAKATSISSEQSVVASPIQHDQSSGYESLQESQLRSPVSYSPSIQNVSTDPQTPVSSRPEKLKRRWLREALIDSPPSPFPSTSTANANQLRPTVLIMANKSPVSGSFEPSDTSTPAKSRTDSVLTRALQNAEKQWSTAVALIELSNNHH
jgi:hypothetical protein